MLRPEKAQESGASGHSSACPERAQDVGASRRADLHVHTCHSKVSGTLPFLGSRDCYSKPADVYRVAKSRGMDLVAITDHDSIGGALELLDAHPDAADIIVGEEVSCRLPDGDIEVHLGVYGMTETLHRELQPLRRDVFEVIARLRDADVFFSLNHLLHFYRGQIPFDRYLQLLHAVPALEVRNGTMLAAHNGLIERLAATFVPATWSFGRGGDGNGGRRLAAVAGSDAHTLRRVGTTWTEAPGRTREEFLNSLRRGLGVPGGVHGTTATIAGDAYGVVARYVASLIGFGPRDLPMWRRSACLAFAAVSAPFQFIPLLIAANGKSHERRQVEQALAYFAAADVAAPVAAALEPQL
jgi:predicted metal-dependent phosphoesterase TrpH